LRCLYFPLLYYVVTPVAVVVVSPWAPVSRSFIKRRVFLAAVPLKLGAFPHFLFFPSCCRSGNPVIQVGSNARLSFSLHLGQAACALYCDLPSVFTFFSFFALLPALRIEALVVMVQGRLAKFFMHVLFFLHSFCTY